MFVYPFAFESLLDDEPLELFPRTLFDKPSKTATSRNAPRDSAQTTFKAAAFGNFLKPECVSRGMESNNNHENNPTPPDTTPTDQSGKFRPGNGENVSDTNGKTPLRKSAYGTPKTTNALQNA